jgi:hypothetical protein
MPDAVALKEGRPVRGMQAVAEHPDGTRMPFVPYPTPLKDVSGTVIGAINLLMDITGQRTGRLRQPDWPQSSRARTMRSSANPWKAA